MRVLARRSGRPQRPGGEAAIGLASLNSRDIDLFPRARSSNRSRRGKFLAPTAPWKTPKAWRHGARPQTAPQSAPGMPQPPQKAARQHSNLSALQDHPQHQRAQRGDKRRLARQPSHRTAPSCSVGQTAALWLANAQSAPPHWGLGHRHLPKPAPATGRTVAISVTRSCT